MTLDGPPLDTVRSSFQNDIDFSTYPFSLPVVKNITTITLPTQVTFIVGENGSGKSTILEALALKAGFGLEGGSKNMYFTTAEEEHKSQSQKLADQLILSWRKKPTEGYFFRAESFFNVANFLDVMSKEPYGGKTFDSYGGKSLHKQSHGESFLSFFTNRIGVGGFYIFDEPEAALSPQRQLTLLKIINDLCNHQHTQFIIATHSPILLAYPNAAIYSCDGNMLERVDYTDTKHYQISKGFLNNPEQYLRHLFQDDK